MRVAISDSDNLISILDIVIIPVQLPKKSREAAKSADGLKNEGGAAKVSYLLRKDNNI